MAESLGQSADTKLVSIILPSRKRPHRLLNSLDSLYATANNPEDLEVVIRFDDDDPESLEVMPVLRSMGAKVLVGSRYKGYASLHVFTNECAEECVGKWFFLWGDDAIMTTKGWDDVIRATKYKLCIIKFNDKFLPGPGGFSCFPIIPRLWFEILGHVSLQSACDVWIEEARRVAGLTQWWHPEIRIKHFNPANGRGIHIMKEHYDETFKEVRELQLTKTLAEAHSKETKKKQRKDGKKLREYIHATSPKIAVL